jgi:hypothetical protein
MCLNPVNGSVILAVPPASLSKLITADLYGRAPWWGRVLKLRNEPMASVHLHFNDRWVERLGKFHMNGLPKEPVILLDSRFSITFIDNSRIWPDVKRPYLHVIASDYRELSLLDRKNPAQHTYQGRVIPKLMELRAGKLDMTNPKSPLDHILAELARYVPFSIEDLNLDLLEIESNMNYPIFINEIGSWPNRPTTKTAFGNLFMAGAHCQNAIDVTTVEGAVLSGLQAAEAVRRRHGFGEKIEIIQPETRPFYAYTPLQLMGAPFAMCAKVWSEMYEYCRRAEKMGGPLLPREGARSGRASLVSDLLSTPYQFGAELMSRWLDVFRK